MGPELPKDFKEFLSLLRVHGVEYLLIGAYAVGYHGYPRATKDLDIWIAVTPDNAARLVTCLKDFGFDTPDLSTELFLQEHNVVRMGLEPNRIEILTSISGVNFVDCYPLKVSAILEGIVGEHHSPGASQGEQTRQRPIKRPLRRGAFALADRYAYKCQSTKI